MKIRKVRIKNINSLKADRFIQIDFDNDPLGNVGLFAITGDTGAGKTSILDAITLGLYGEVHRNKDVKEIMSYGTADAMAEVEFEVRGVLYRSNWTIKRARNKVDGRIQTPKRTVSQWNEKEKAFIPITQKISEAKLFVEQVTGLDYGRFTRSVLLSQGDFAAFLKATERERSELLERITGTEVYSQLSIGAFERNKKEYEALQVLQQQLDALELFNPEAFDALQTELSSKLTEEKKQQKQRTSLQEQVRQLELLQQYQEQKEKLEQQLQLLLSQKAVAQQDEELLAQYQKVVPLKPTLALLEDIDTDRPILEGQLRDIAFKIPELDTRLKQAEANQTLLQQRNNEKETDFNDQLPLIDAVIALDISYQKEILKLKSMEQGLIKVKDNAARLQNQLNTIKAEKEQKRATEEELKEWLSGNHHLALLSEQLPLIKDQRTQLLEWYRNNRACENEIENLGKKSEQLDEEKAELIRQKEEQKKQIDAIDESYKGLLPPNFVSDRSELLHQLHVQIEELIKQNNGLQDLYRLADEYQEHLSEFSIYQDQLEQLRSQDLQLSKSLMNVLDEMDMLKPIMEYKQHIYEQQLMIANYEADRNRLKEGEECPLCFSTDHPFRKKEVKPYVDRAKVELEAIKEKYQKVYEVHKTYLSEQKEIETQIEQLAGNEHKQIKGRLGQQRERILAYETRMEQLFPALTSIKIELSNKKRIAKKIEESAAMIESLKQSRNELTVLINQLEIHEKQAEETEKKRYAIESEIRINEGLLANQKKRLAEGQQKFEDLVNQLNLLLEPFEFSFQLDTAKETFITLERLQKEWGDKSTAHRSITQELVILEKDEVDTTKRMEEYTVRLESQEKELKEVQQAGDEILAKRRTLFDDKDPTEERKRMQEEMLALKEALNLANTLAIKLANQKSELTQHQQLKEEQLKNLLEKAKKQETVIGLQLEELGFNTLDALKQALLPEEQVEAIEKRLSALEETFKEVNINLKTITTQEQTLIKETADWLPLQTLKEKLVIVEEQYDVLQKEIGRLTERKSQQLAIQDKAKDLKQQYEVQHSIYVRWSKLNEIIGAADGKKFRTFAQGLTLKKLAYLANLHLKALNARYIIQKRNNEDLQLEIIDTYQANNLRSMNTLSGGESFLVSLALALGLSDLAGRNAKIESLFIDEGFGTLDDNSLDIAISTLENLQASGKTIGIISHVKALKERINTQIFVKKKGDGFSEVEIRS